MGRWETMALLIAVLIGLALRLGGLSHDLDAGFVYHPDTPKQMRAAERFLQGEYFAHTGHSDYDGYPLFHAHLIEYVVRISQFVVDGTASLLGLKWEPSRVPIQTLYWLGRAQNAVLATLLIFLVHRMGRRLYGPVAGLIAAFLLAVSPADMAAAHFESGDTPASFFATVTIFFATKILFRARWSDYVLAGFFGLCAFASKYHAGMALVAVGVAHLLREGHWRNWFKGPSLRLVGVLAASCIVSLFLTVPSMFTRTTETLGQIYSFLTYVAGDKRIERNDLDTALSARFAFSMHRNLPILVHILSPGIALVIIVALGKLLRWDRRYVVLFTLPLIYFFVGVSLLPNAHVIYHTLMTPVLFVIAAGWLSEFTSGGTRTRDLRKALAAVAFGSALGLLGMHSLRECFFFWHSDTRRLAQAWTKENVPKTFWYKSDPYSFELPEFVQTAEPMGILSVQSSIRTFNLPDDFFPLRTFALEDDSLPFFRNPVITLSLGRSAHIRDGFKLPAFQRVPARSGNEVILLDDAGLFRSEKCFLVDETRRVRRVCVTQRPLPYITMVAKAGALPSRLDAEFGGKSESVVLQPGEVRVLRFLRPKRGFPFDRERSFYRLKLAASWGRVRVTMGTTLQEEGVALYQHGLFDTASDALLAAFTVDPSHPTVAAMTLAAHEASGRTLDQTTRNRLLAAAMPLADLKVAGRMVEVFGVSHEYLHALPFLSWTGNRFEPADTMELRDRLKVRSDSLELPPDTYWAVRGPPFSLEPGAYHVRVKFLSEFDLSKAPAFHIRCTGTSGNVLMDMSTTLPPPGLLGHAYVDFPFEVHGVDAELQFDIEGVATHPASLLEVSVMPDVSRTLAAANELVQRIDTGKDIASLLPTPGASSGLPHGYEPLVIDFENDVSLQGYRLSASSLQAGDPIALDLAWYVAKPADALHRCGVWVHVLNEKLEKVMTLDRGLLADVHQRIGRGSRSGFILPANTPPGRYSIVLGVYDVTTGQRMKPGSGSVKRLDRGIVLPATLVVEERPEP